MQGCAPEAVDCRTRAEATQKLYGLDDPVTEPFGRQCLLARRLVERGVRFVQLYHGGLGNQNTDTWDAHANVKENHTQHAKEVDKPIAGLLTDLKARGLLDKTLVVWHGEFGRMPISQRGLGRDHNPGAMSIWMAGAGIQGGQAIGASDDFGYKAEEQPCHPRSARHDAAPARHGSHQADLPLQRPEHAADRRVWRADSADRGLRRRTTRTVRPRTEPFRSPPGRNAFYLRAWQPSGTWNRDAGGSAPANIGQLVDGLAHARVALFLVMTTICRSGEYQRSDTVLDGPLVADLAQLGSSPPCGFPRPVCLR